MIRIEVAEHYFEYAIDLGDKQKEEKPNFKANRKEVNCSSDALNRRKENATLMIHKKYGQYIYGRNPNIVA